MSISMSLLVFGICHVALLFAHGTYIAITHGLQWGTGRRDQPIDTSDLGRRFNRSITNNVESVSAYGPISVVALFVSVQSTWVEIAAFVFVLARLSFLLCYLANIPYIRTVFWLLGQISILIMAGITLTQVVA